MLRQKKVDRSGAKEKGASSTGASAPPLPGAASTTSGGRKKRPESTGSSRYHSLLGATSGGGTGGHGGDSDSDDQLGPHWRSSSATRKARRDIQKKLSGNMTGSSDEDLDPELKEGINNIMRLRDEYDKLEGALRKLGVDPHAPFIPDDDFYEGDEDEQGQPDSVIIPDLDPLRSRSMDPNPSNARRHLDILEELLELVQSFQLDTTMAGVPEDSRLQSQVQMALVSQTFLQNPQKSGLDGCDGNKKCDRSGRRTAELGEEPDDRGGSDGGNQQQSGRETHSCPSSPTETDCSSGFSTLRRRSVTLTEKIRTNRDGSKTQVVRQYGCNTSAGNEPPDQNVFHQNSYVYINGSTTDGGIESSSMSVNPIINANSSQSFPSSLSILPVTSCQTSSIILAPSSHAGASTSMSSSTLPRCSVGISDQGSLGRVESPGGLSNTLRANHSSSQGSGLANLSADISGAAYRGHIIRLNSIEPNTVMFSTRDYPILNDVTVPEIIDELEKQFEDQLSDLQGVRLVANNVYICLSRKESLEHLTTYGFYVRGVHISVVDITNESVVICLTGVPHYITDATVTMLVSTFGISIGEVERRFYKGVDTGERYVRLKPRARSQIPDYVTVGGCKIVIRVLSPDDVRQPFVLQSATTTVASTTSEANNAINTITTTGPDADKSSLSSLQHSLTGSISGAGSSAAGVGGPKSRSKPGHCNGTVNTTSSTQQSSSSMTSSLITTSTPINGGGLLTSAPRTEIISTGITGLITPSSSTTMAKSASGSIPVAPPVPPTSSGLSTSKSGLIDGRSTPTSPKIGKSWMSRFTNPRGSIVPTEIMLKEEDEVDRSANSYIPGDDLDIPTLSPPPYKAPSSSAGSVSSSGNNNNNTNANNTASSSHLFKGSLSKTGGELQDPKVNGHGVGNKGSRESSLAGLLSSSSFRRYRSSSKTDTSNSLITSSSLAAKSTEAVRDGTNNLNNNNPSSTIKRSGVAFDEDKKKSKHRSSTAVSASNIHSKTVNGILRKGSGPGDEIVADDVPGTTTSTNVGHKSGRKSHKSKKSSSSSKYSKVTRGGGDESGPEGDHRDEVKSKSGNKDKERDKHQKDLALTRDLPWCGCWGNGCL